MSYDLYLSSPQLNLDAFTRYFKGRAQYHVGGEYWNEDTGVYFNFYFDERGIEDEEAPELMRRPHAQFNLNYFRPHVFGLEAEPEVSAFVTAFGCAIEDPQRGGMGAGPYAREGFLNGWNRGNKFGCEALGGRAGDDMLVVDDAAIERVWRHNLERAALQERLGEAHFVPRVNWAKSLSDGAPIAIAVWGEGVAMAFPECATHALLVKQRRSERGLFGGKKKEGLEVKLMPLTKVAALDGCKRLEGEMRVLLAPLSMPPSRAVLSAFTGRFSAMDEVMKGVALDHVLDASLVSR
jgi:hypothetical protein